MIDRSTCASLQLGAVLMIQTSSSCALCKQICSNDRKSRMTGWGWFVSHMLPVWSFIWFRSSSWRSDRDRRSEVIDLTRLSRVCPALWMFVGLLWPCELLRRSSAASVLRFCVSACVFGSVFDFHLIKADFYKTGLVSVFVIQNVKPTDSLRWVKTIIVD